MSDLRPVQTDHASVDRRRFLKVTGAGVAGASLLTMLDARQAPAQLKGTTLRILKWSHFIPAYDVWFDKFAKEWGDKNGVKVRVDHIPHLEIPARMAAEFAAGTGHDIIYNGSSILDPALLQEPGRPHGRRRRRRQEVRGLDPRGEIARRGRGPHRTASRSSTSCCRCSTGRTCSTRTT